MARVTSRDQLAALLTAAVYAIRDTYYADVEDVVNMSAGRFITTVLNLPDDTITQITKDTTTCPN